MRHWVSARVRTISDSEVWAGAKLFLHAQQEGVEFGFAFSGKYDGSREESMLEGILRRALLAFRGARTAGEAIHLVANCLIFHNVCSLTRLVGQLQDEGEDVPEAALACVSPT